MQINNKFRYTVLSDACDATAALNKFCPKMLVRPPLIIIICVDSNEYKMLRQDFYAWKQFFWI